MHREIDRRERNRSKSVAEAVRHEPERRRRAGLTLSRGAVVVVELDPDQLRSIDKRRIRRVLGELAQQEIGAIDEGLAVFLGLSDRGTAADPD
jgi:mRNA-degrading endonuclease toxin of MazEF toxin-antitoxin module